MQRLRPVPFSKLASKKRSPARNWQLGILLAPIAGFINAGGFVIVHQYTSHMTGILSSAAYDIGHGEFVLAISVFSYMLCFISGAMFTTILVLLARRFALHAQFSLPLLLEAALLSVIVILTTVNLAGSNPIPYLIAVFSFLMGLQNALITKASTAIVRTTHVTGISTDIGILLGRLLFSENKDTRRADVTKVLLFLVILLAFFVGGVGGAALVQAIGATGLLLPSLVLISLAIPAVWKDFQFASNFRNRRRRKQGSRPA